MSYSTVKKRTRRSKEKYPALKPELNVKSRYDNIDYDYIDKLSEKEKEWLNKFTDEYVNTNLDRKNLDNNLHKTKEQKVEIDAKDHARKRDILTRAKTHGKVIELNDIPLDERQLNNYEDYLVNEIDKKNKKWYEK